MDLAQLIQAIPVVADVSERAARFPNPDLNFRVHSIADAAIQRWDGSQWVTDFVSANAQAVAAAAKIAGRYLEWRVVLDEALNDGSVMSLTLNAYSRFNQPSGQVDGGFTRISTDTQQAVFRLVDSRRCFSPEHTVTALCRNIWSFRAHNRVFLGMDFRDVFGSVTSVPDATGTPNLFATSLMAWMRKRNSGDSSSSRFTFGFGDNTSVGASKTVARCGLIGDGAGGYRFGSVNCPDGFASGDNAPTDIDANPIAPSELTNANLLTNWFHVRIRLVPPTPQSAAGRWEGYLNGRLVQSFSLAANLPRGALGTNNQFTRLEPTIYQFGDSVAASPAPVLHDIRMQMEDL